VAGLTANTLILKDAASKPEPVGRLDDCRFARPKRAMDELRLNFQKRLQGHCRTQTGMTLCPG
jgi:hypothetical protein